MLHYNAQEHCNQGAIERTEDTAQITPVLVYLANWWQLWYQAGECY